MNLYEISAELNAILSKLDTEDGEIPPGIEVELDAVVGNYKDKVDNVLRYRVSLLASAEGIDTEIQRLTKMRNSLNKRADWLKSYVEQSMRATNQTKVDTRLFKLWIQRNGRPSVILQEDVGIPEVYKKTIPAHDVFDSEKVYQEWREWSSDEQALAQFTAALPAGVKVELGSHLRIK